MSQKPDDKMAAQTQTEGSADKDPNDEAIDPKADSTEEPLEAPGNIEPDAISEATGNSDETQTVTETSEQTNKADEGEIANKADQQPSMNPETATAIESKVDNKESAHPPSDNSADSDSDTELKSGQPEAQGKTEEPNGRNQAPSKSDTAADDHLAAGAESDQQPDGEGEAENEASKSKDSSTDEDAATAQESAQTEEDQGGDPKATDSADDDPSAEKELDTPDENKETFSSEEDSDDNGEDASQTELDPDDALKQSGPESVRNDENAASTEDKQNDPLESDAEKDPPEGDPIDAETETEDLPDLAPQKKIPFAKAALITILVAAAISGFFIFDNKSNIKSDKKTDLKEATQPPSQKASQKNMRAAIQPDDPNYIYYAKIDEISSLREALLFKNEEISELKKHYHLGIDELEKEILDELQDSDNITFYQAIENKRIEFALRTIQRRLAYIRQLDQPADWTFQAAEDLLYIKRKALMDIQVTEVASGVDMNTHLRHMNTALNKYRPTADKLAIDMKDASSESLQSIWQQIQNRRLAYSSQRVHSKNQVILEQICAGNFSRLAELSEVSVDSAKCIVEMQGTDLFLNGLTDISPSAARHLFQWKGNWICLNGFRAITPRVAAYLFTWKGHWISLNGLTDFPPEIGNLLLQWEGSQLELMGLRYTDSLAAKSGIKLLAQWERSGGRLFVPKTIRKKIDEINGNHRLSAERAS